MDYIVLGYANNEALPGVTAEDTRKLTHMNLAFGVIKDGLLDMLYREAKVENVEYSETIDVTAVCGPRTLGQVEPFIAE